VKEKGKKVNFFEELDGRGGTLDDIPEKR